MTWEIFCADNNNVYLITRESLEADSLITTGYKGTNDFSDLTNFPAVSAGWLSGVYNNGEVVYESSFYNMRGTEYLLDSTKWSSYVDASYAEYAIGGPTLEMLSASLELAGNDVISCSVNGYGYSSSGYTPLEDLTSGTVWHRNTSYWLACPGDGDWNALWYMKLEPSENGELNMDFYSGSHAFRPIVCLKSEVTLTRNENTGTYTVSIT